MFVGAWQIIKDNKIKVIGVSVSMIVAIMTFFINYSVEIFLVPKVIKSLKDKKYIRDEISEGRFVSTGKKEFCNNYEISSEQLTALNQEKLARKSDLLDFKKDINNNLNTFKNEFNKINTIDLIRVKKELATVKEALSILETKELGKFKIKIYFSDNEKEKGLLILNQDNSIISKFINNNEKYHINSVNNNDERYVVRLEKLSTGGKNSFSAIGRLYKEDYHELFESAKSSGVGEAYIIIN